MARTYSAGNIITLIPFSKDTMKRKSVDEIMAIINKTLEEESGWCPEYTKQQIVKWYKTKEAWE